MTTLIAIGVLIGTWMASGDDSYHHCVRFEIDQSGILRHLLSFYGGIKPMTGTSYGSTGSASIGHDGDWLYYGGNPGICRWRR